MKKLFLNPELIITALLITGKALLEIAKYIERNKTVVSIVLIIVFIIFP